MKIKQSTSLWLIRFYALGIAVVVLGDILEGGAYRFVIVMALVLILVQTFILAREK